MYWGWNYIWSNLTLHSEISIPALELSGVLVSIAHCWEKFINCHHLTITHIHMYMFVLLRYENKSKAWQKKFLVEGNQEL